MASADYIAAILGGDGERTSSSKNIVEGLFGLSPELTAAREAQARYQGSQQQAMQFAQLDPYQRANYMLYQGGSGMAGGLMGALGPNSAAVEEALQEAKLTQELKARGIALNNPQGYLQAAQVANELGMPKFTAKFGMASAVLDKERAAAEKARRIDTDEKIKIASWNEALRLNNGDEAKAAALMEDKDFQRQVQLRIAGRSVTNVTVDMKQDTEFMKQLGQLQADRLKTAYNKAEEANTSLQSLSKLSELSNKPLISGTAAAQRTDVANFLSTVGLASKQDTARLANSQEFDKEAKALAITWAKKLGFNPSNADVQFIVAALPSAMTDATARNNIINRMAKMNQDVIDETARMETYAVKNKNLNGYRPTIQGYNPTSGFAPKGGVKDLSDEELAAAIAAKKGKK